MVDPNRPNDKYKSSTYDEDRARAAKTDRNGFAVIAGAVFLIFIGIVLLCSSCTSPMGLDDAHKKHMDIYDWDIAEEDSTS